MIKHLLFCDFETYYDKEFSLRKMSPPEYILDSKFQVLMMAAFDIEWAAPKIILPAEIPAFLKQYPPNETMVVGHNQLFDGAILSWKYGWVPARSVDTLGMVRSLRSFKRNSLGAVAEQLFGFDSKGSTLAKVIGLDTQGIKDNGLWPDFCSYALNDVRICAQIFFKLLPEFPEEEREIMDLVLRAAIQPVLQADVDLLQTHLDGLRQRKARLLRECGFDRAALMSTAQFKDALINLGVPIKTKISATGREVPAFAKSDPFMSELAEYSDADAETNYAVQTLAMARLSHKSTIEESRAERFINIAKLTDDHLLPVPLRYGGAHTHRLSGEWQLNLQNLPRDQRKSQLRSALVAPAGFKLIAADLAQIEARIVGKICGQDSLIEEFKQGDVYASFASRVFGKTITKKRNPHERFIGKTAILGLGYGCGAARFHQMVQVQARQNNIPLQGLFDERRAEQIVQAYRSLYSRIPDTWRYLDRQLIDVINTQNTNQVVEWGPVKFMSGRIQLPNGMFLRYQVGEMDLFGAKILENVTQALARIVIMQAAVRLARQGLRFVLQAHDELVFVVLNAKIEESKKLILNEMTREPKWLLGLPLAVEVGVGVNYGETK